MKNDTITTKIQNSPYITRKNLELFIGSNRRTADYRIKSLIEKGNLLRIKKGFYISPAYLEKEPNKQLYLEYLGTIINYLSYVSLTYALAKYNLIPEKVSDITYITLKKPKNVKTPVKNFTYRNINKDLYTGFEPLVYQNKNVYFAKPFKALFDFVYFAKFSTKEKIKEFVTNSRINWDVLDYKNKTALEKLLKQNGSNKMRTFLEVLKENKIL